jgi:hypothetical protein
MRKKLDTVFLFGATLLAVAIECALLWWRWHTMRFTAGPGAFYTGDWLGPLLPEAWLIGVTAAMIHRMGLIVYEREKMHIHRGHFRRLAYSFIALASVEGCMLWIPLVRVIR